jgi:hypothetical protein
MSSIYLFYSHGGDLPYSLLYLRCRNTHTVNVTKTFVVTGHENLQCERWSVKEILIACLMMSGLQLPPAIEYFGRRDPTEEREKGTKNRYICSANC